MKHIILGVFLLGTCSWAFAFEIDSSCFKLHAGESVKATLEEAVKAGVECAQEIKVPEVFEAAMILDHAVIKCESSMNKKTLAYVLPNPFVSQSLTQNYKISIGPSVYTNEEGVAPGVLFHEALHFTASNNFPNLIHNDHEELQKYGGIQADRIYLLSEICFPKPYAPASIIWVLRNQPQLCQFALTSTHHEFHLAWGSENLEAIPYSEDYAHLVCKASFKYLKRKLGY